MKRDMDLIRIIFLVIIRIIAALFACIGVGLDIAGGELASLSSDTWVDIAFISIVVFILLTAWRETELILQQKPNIIVEPEIINDRARLIVKNIGTEADFTAKARVIASLPEAELYTMYWEDVVKKSCHIDGGGGMATILVGGKATYESNTSDINTFFMKGDLVLYKMGESAKMVFPAYSGESEITQDSSGQQVISGKPIERCIIEITITATPKLKKKWDNHRYLCEIEDGKLKLTETDLSTPNLVRRY